MKWIIEHWYLLVGAFGTLIATWFGCKWKLQKDETYYKPMSESQVEKEIKQAEQEHATKIKTYEKNADYWRDKWNEKLKK